MEENQPKLKSERKAQLQVRAVQAGTVHCSNPVFETQSHLPPLLRVGELEEVVLGQAAENVNPKNHSA